MIWHGIPFESFARLSATNLPDSSFYTRFYELLHHKCRSIDDLDQSWVRLKRQVAGLIINNPEFKKSDRILSVGCGLGLIEMVLLQEGFCNVEITEVSETPLKWVRPLLPVKNVHVGFFPDCIPHNEKYDLVLLISVEYFLNKKELLNLLRSVHDRLMPGGACLLVSWSFDIVSFPDRLLLKIKDYVRQWIYMKKEHHKVQFIGYLRLPSEFRRAMRAAGYVNCRDGMLDKETHWNTYWIRGNK